MFFLSTSNDVVLRLVITLGHGIILLIRVRRCSGTGSYGSGCTGPRSTSSRCSNLAGFNLVALGISRCQVSKLLAVHVYFVPKGACSFFSHCFVLLN